MKFDHIFKTTERQFGFKKKHSMVMGTGIVNINTVPNVNVIILDASKTFDRVHYILLFNILQNRNICPLIIRFYLDYIQTKK